MCSDLACWQVVHCCTYFLTCSFICGHENKALMR
jgi:hypothetical protein